MCGYIESDHWFRTGSRTNGRRKGTRRRIPYNNIHHLKSLLWRRQWNWYNSLHFSWSCHWLPTSLRVLYTWRDKDWKWSRFLSIHTISFASTKHDSTGILLFGKCLCRFPFKSILWSSIIRGRFTTLSLTLISFWVSGYPLILSVHLLHRVSHSLTLFLPLFFFLRGDYIIGGDFLFHSFLPARSPWNVSFGTWKQSNLLPWI